MKALAEEDVATFKSCWLEGNYWSSHDMEMTKILMVPLAGVLAKSEISDISIHDGYAQFNMMIFDPYST